MTADTDRDPNIEALAYESTQRGECLASFAHRFHEWEADDDRWEYVQAIWGLVELIDKGGDVLEPLEQIAACALVLLGAVDDLVSGGPDSDARTIANVLSLTEAIQEATKNYLTSIRRPIPGMLL